jgi:hypothetical protein
MRRVSTFFAVILSSTLSILGIFMLHEGGANKSLSEAAMLIGGAVCSTLGMMTFVSTVRPILWRRGMLRHSIPKDYLDGALLSMSVAEEKLRMGILWTRKRINQTKYHSTFSIRMIEFCGDNI